VPLYPDMSVRSYLDFMGKIKAVKERRREVDRAMEKARIAHRASDQIGKLSKGLRQRVGLAQALLGDPPVLILDEPTSGLDPKQIIEVRNLIKSLGGEHTVILSTHILPEVAATCSRIVIISNGRVVAEDTPENLDRRLKGAESIALTVRGPSDQVTKVLKGVPHVTSVLADGDGRAPVGQVVPRPLFRVAADDERCRAGDLDLIAADDTLWEMGPLNALTARGELMAFRHNGFWQPMDTLREKRYLEDLWGSGKAPWKCWP